MHWKVKRDSYYNSLYPLLGQSGIEEAGFFYDSASTDIDINDSLNWLCTPFYFPKLPNTKNPCVLLSTGAFCPIHEGHIEMMTLAKKALEADGYEVLGGYLSPGHDAYISQKAGNDAIPIQKRIAAVQKMILEQNMQDWLMVDPWEGLFCSVAVNFTDVMQRLSNYLAQHLGQEIPVFYVCGGDNARFALTFMQKGHCVVVGRPPYEDAFLKYQKQFNKHPRIFWVEAHNPINSSAIRKETTIQTHRPSRLQLRVEEQDERESQLIQLLSSHFEEIDLQYLSQQQQQFQQLEKHPLISLDGLLPGDYNLQISRCFDFFGSRQLGYRARPGSPAIEQQLADIPMPNSDYLFYLFDDDKHSGATEEFARRALQSIGIEIHQFISFQNQHEGNFETLDCRDFLIGGASNGLVVQLQDNPVRAPYCYPYCCPFIRASIFDSLRFSIAIWQLNADYFSTHNTPLKDIAPTSKQLFQYIGFEASTPMQTICTWHIEQLRQFLDGL
jgi:nicotinic acid mononucleotide adenylyltransferase